MFCSKCGKENVDSAKFCSSCGNNLIESDNASQHSSNSTEINEQSQNLKIGWIILSVLFPLAGIIIFLNLKSTYPKKANDAILSAGIGMILGLIFYAA